MNQKLFAPLNQMANEVHHNAVQHGFHPKDEPIDLFIANQVANLHAEVTELWDAHRAGTSSFACNKALKMKKMGLPVLSCREEEYADIIIRTLDQCARLGVDIASAVAAKHEYNKTREFKHGKKN